MSRKTPDIEDGQNKLRCSSMMNLSIREPADIFAIQERDETNLKFKDRWVGDKSM